MTRDFRQWWIDDYADVGGDVPRRPAAGKVSLTQRIPVQRRANPDARPVAKAPPVEPFSFVQAYGGEVKEPVSAAFPDENPVSWLSADADHACRAAFDFDFRPVQRAASATASADTDAIHVAAARGLETPASPLPHLDQIQNSFGHHDVAHVRAHVGGAAAEGSAAMGATAYATGSDVVFASSPDLHTAAHEAAHVIQQKGGVQLKGGVGQEGDAYEQHADAVADKVVRGESAEALLDEMAGTGAPAVGVQQQKRGTADAPGGKSVVPTEVAFASPMTELATHAKPVVEAAMDVHLALHTGKTFLDADLVRLQDKLAELANFLHRHATERTPNDDAALRAAIDAASGVANTLPSRSGPHRKIENELRRHVVDIRNVLEENTAREAKLESPSALAGMVDESLAAFGEWRAFSKNKDALEQMPGLSGRSLDDVIVTTMEWAEALKADRGAAERLSRAIIDQYDIVTMASAELQQVLKQPTGPTTKDTIHGYFQVMAMSTGRRQKSNDALERARAMRRRLPLDRAASALEDDFSQTLALEQFDKEAGGKARAEHRALAQRTNRMEARIADGKHVTRGEIDDLVLETREYEFLHRVDLLRAQAKQTLDAINQIGGPRTVEKVDVQLKLDELISSLAGVRRRYKDAAEPGDDESPRAKKREALRIMEIQLQHQLKTDNYDGALKKAASVIEDQIVHQFVSQLLWTIALTVSGNFVAAAARGAAEATVLRMGATELGAARAATVVAYASEATYGAVTQKYIQGDPASLATLLAVNVLTPLAIERVMGLAKMAERVGEGAAEAASKSERLLDDAARLSDAGDAAKSAADDAAEAVSLTTRLDQAAKKSLWVKSARSGGLALRGGANLTAEMIIGASVDYATRRAAAEGGRPPDEQTAAEWLMQGAAMAIGRHLSVNVKAIQTRLEAVQSLSRGATAHLLKAAGGVSADSSLLEAGKKDAAAATDVLQRYLELLAGEKAFLEKELTDTVDGQGRYGRKQLLASLDANRRATGEMRKLGSGELNTGGDRKTRAPGRGPESPSTGGDSGVTWTGDRYVASHGSLHHVRESWASAGNGDKVSEIHFDPKTNTAHFEVKRGRQRVRVEAQVPPAITSGADVASATNRVLGKPIKSRKVGDQILRDLNAGRMETLAKLGIEVPPATKPDQAMEYGLGELSDGTFVVVIGEPGKVDWDQVPGAVPRAHTHPSTEGNDLGKHAGSERIALMRLFEATLDPLIVRELVFPSPSDVRIMARQGIDGHRVITPFVVRDGHVMKPGPDDGASPPLEWVIRKPVEVGRTEDGDVVFEWTIVGEVNGKAVTKPKKVWSTEPPSVATGNDGPGVDLGSHSMEAPRMVPADRQGPHGSRATRQPSIDAGGSGPDSVKVLAAISAKTGIGADKLAINGHAPDDHVAMRSTASGLEVSYKAGTPEATIVAEVEAHIALVADHGVDAANWAGATLDGAAARRLLDSVNATAIVGLRDITAAEAQKNVDVFGKANIESSVPPMTGRRFNVERAQMGEKAASGLAANKVNQGKTSLLAAHADNLDGSTAAPHVPLEADSLIVDTNVLSAIKELMGGMAWNDLQPHKKVGINHLRHRATPKLPPLTGDPALRDMASIIGEGHDLRAANSTLGESAPMSGLDRSGFELTISRDSTQYSNVLDELAMAPPVGKAGGIGDRAIVADAMFAKGQAKPSLMTGDRNVIDRLFTRYGPGKTTPITQKLGQSVTAAIAETYPNGFDVEIPDGAGKTKTLTIIPMAA